MGNTVGSLRQHNISSREKAIIIGTLLGDAHIDSLKAGGRLEIGHSEKQKEYLFWKYNDSYGLFLNTLSFEKIAYPYIIPSMSYKLSYNPVTTSFVRLDRARDRKV